MLFVNQANFLACCVSGADVEQLDNPATVKGDESVLPGFVLVMEGIW